MIKNSGIFLVLVAGFLFVVNGINAQKKTPRDLKVLNDMKHILNEGFWIYNDIDKGFKEAKRTGKPLLVTLRCIPCEECVKLDEELLEQDPVVQALMKKFVCVRRVYTNGIDLNLFQYDTDQSFTVMMFNADGTIYGRYGTRSDRIDWENDVSIQGLAEAMKGALKLHDNFPQYKKSLAGKTGKPAIFSSPEKYPALKGKFKDKPDYSGALAKSCIHCHQIGDAQRLYYRNQNKPIPQEILYPYTHPKALGLILDQRLKQR